MRKASSDQAGSDSAGLPSPSPILVFPCKTASTSRSVWAPAPSYRAVTHLLRRSVPHHSAECTWSCTCPSPSFTKSALEIVLKRNVTECLRGGGGGACLNLMASDWFVRTKGCKKKKKKRGRLCSSFPPTAVMWTGSWKPPRYILSTIVAETVVKKTILLLILLPSD